MPAGCLWFTYTSAKRIAAGKGPLTGILCNQHLLTACTANVGIEGFLPYTQPMYAVGNGVLLDEIDKLRKWTWYDRSRRPPCGVGGPSSNTRIAAMDTRDKGFAAFLLERGEHVRGIGDTGSSRLATYPISTAMSDTAGKMRIGELVLVLWRNPRAQYVDGTTTLTHHHQRQDWGIFMGFSADYAELHYRLLTAAELRADRASLKKRAVRGPVSVSICRARSSRTRRKPPALRPAVHM